MSFRFPSFSVILLFHLFAYNPFNKPVGCSDMSRGIVGDLKSNFGNPSVLFQTASDLLDPVIEFNAVSLSGIAISPLNGHVFFVKEDTGQIFKFFENNEVELVAGSGEFGYADGDSMISKFSSTLNDIAFNYNGSLLAVADTANNVVRLLSMAEGRVSTLAGAAGVAGFKDDVGIKATFNYPTGLTFDSVGNILVVDYGNSLIRKIDPAGRVTTVAGNGNQGWNGEKGPARSISLNRPNDIVFDPNDKSFYFTDALNSAVRRVNSSGYLTTVTKNETIFFFPWGIEKADRSLIISDFYFRYTVKVDLDLEVAEVFAGSKESIQGAFDGSFKDAQFQGPRYMTVDPKNASFILLSDVNSIRSISFKNRFVSTLLRSTGIGVSDGLGIQVRFNRPHYMTIDVQNQIIYVSDANNHAIRRILITLNNKVETVVGQGQAGYLDGPLSLALLNYPSGLLVDPDDFNKVYVCDNFNNRVRLLDMAGKNISTFVAGIYSPRTISKDQNGNFYIATYSSDVKMVDINGQITKIAGGDVACNDGNGYSASFGLPYDLASDLEGGIFISSSYCHQIKHITLSSGYVNTIAGGGNMNYGLLDGYGYNAEFNQPGGLSFFSNGSLYIADTMNHAIRKLSTKNYNYVTTISGNGQMGYRNGASALYNNPYDTVRINDSLYIADTNNHAIRVIKNVTDYNNDNQVVTVAGYGAPVYHQNSKKVSNLHIPNDIVCMENGLALVLDSTANVILKLKIGNNGLMETFEAFAGNASPGWLDGVGINAMFMNPSAMAILKTRLIVADTGNHLIRSVDLTNSAVTTIAGTGNTGNVVNRDPLKSSFSKPRGVAVDPASSTIFIADSGNNCIKKINSSNILSLVAGSLFGAYGQTDGSGKFARFHNPTAICFDPFQETLFVSDTYNHAIRSIGTDGKVKTIFGSGKVSGFFDGNSSQARFNKPTALALKKTNDISSLFVIDSGNNAIRVISISDETVSTWLQGEKSFYKSIAFCQGQILIGKMRSILSVARLQSSISTNNRASESKSGQVEIILLSSAIGLTIIATALFFVIKNRNRMMMMDKQTTNSVLQTIIRKSMSTKETVADPSCTVNSTASVAYSIPGYLEVDLEECISIEKDLKVSGIGGTAQIIKAKLKDPKLVEKYGNSEIVVKVFGTEISKESFLYEVMLLHSLPKSANLIELIGYSQGHTLSILMKCYPMSLKDFVEKNGPADANFKISVDIANGMNLLHEKGIIHFDLKPANVLIDTVDDVITCVICDFGFANFVSDIQDSIVKGVKRPTAMGITARYAAPELFAKVNLKFSGARAPVDIEKKIDVYAYAMTLYYVYVREAPWKDLSLQDIEIQAIFGKRPDISSQVPKKIKELIEKCWSHDAHERPSFSKILEILPGSDYID